MNTGTFARKLARTGLLLAWLLGLTHSSTAATLADFGYNQMQLNGKEARGGRPLLLILVDFETANPLAHSREYYDDWVFNVFNTNSLNGFFLENSNGRFYWTRAGVGTIGPLGLTSLERGSNWHAIAKANRIPDVHWGEYALVSNIVAKAILSGFDFAPFDTDNDKVIRDGELGILIIQNDGENSGMNRWTTRVKVEGRPIEVEIGRAAAVDHNGHLNVMVHEASHCLGTWDLYGSANLSADLSIMAGTTDGSHIYHMDPWHKMQLGWSEPRIRSVRAGGVVMLPLTQSIQADAPVLLYDPLGDTTEFFMLEYRTPTTSMGTGYDRNVAGSGLVIWHVKQDGAKNPVYIVDLSLGPLPGQPNWRWCSKCQGLAYAGGPSAGPCPEGGLHVTTNGSPYQLVTMAAAPGEHDWRWCHKCQGVFFGGGESVSACPGGGRHERTVSSDYSLVADLPESAGQHGWRKCRKCQGLFHGPAQAQSDCPADWLRHDGSGSRDYAVVGTSSPSRGVFTDGAPDLRHGGNVVWGSGVTTPNLRWLDGSEMPVKVYVHPFSTGDGSITVEWLAEYDTWVDFNYPGGLFFPQFGTYAQPYNTFAEGTAEVSHGGKLKIKAGSSAETGTVAKRMTIQAYGGPVTIGR